MTVEAAFRDSSLSAIKLRDDLHGLTLIIGDKPGDDNAFAESLSNSAEDVLSQVPKTLEVAADISPAAGTSSRLSDEYGAIGVFQESFSHAFSAFSSTLYSHKTWNSLNRLARDRGSEWASWAAAVTGQLEQCEKSFRNTTQSLMLCWQELGSAATTAVRERVTTSPPKPTAALDYARRLFSDYMEWYKNADAKAQILLGLDGAFLAFLTSSVFGKPAEIALVTARFKPETWILLILMCVAMTASIFSALRCLWSRTYSKGVLRKMFANLRIHPGSNDAYPPEVMWFFQMVHALDSTRFKDQLLTVDEQFETRILASQISALSRNIVKKHFWVNRGFLFACVSLVAFVAAMASYVARLHFLSN